MNFTLKIVLLPHSFTDDHLQLLRKAFWSFERLAKIFLHSRWHQRFKDHSSTFYFLAPLSIMSKGNIECFSARWPRWHSRECNSMINWSIQNVNRIVTVRKKGGSKPSLCFQKKLDSNHLKLTGERL